MLLAKYLIIYLVTIAVVLLRFTPGQTQQEQLSKEVVLKFLPNPIDAYMVALLDLRAQSVTDQPFFRYVWIENGDVERAKVQSMILNMVGRGTTILRPEPLGKDKLLVLRIDLRHYAPKVNDLSEWITLWEDLQFDPRFNLLITKGILTALISSSPHWKGKGWIRRKAWIKKVVSPYVFSDGQTYDYKWQQWQSSKLESFSFADLKTDIKDIELIRISAPYIDLSVRSELEHLTNSQAPLVTDSYLTYRLTSTIQDKGVYADIYGGRYYQFAGIRKGAKKGTDEDVLLEQLGVGNVEKGITAKKIFEQLRSDQRVAVFRSSVTGMPRQMEFFRTLTGRLDIASGLISFSHDLKHQNIDIDTHPIMNLLDFKDEAREVIWERQNGLHGYALFNGKGELQDEVPPDIANDHTIPAPHPKRLQGAISCISCHEADGSDGWKRVTNDVKTLVKKTDIFGDVGRKNDAISDTLDRLAGLYQGDPERALQRSRDDYALATLKATGPWKESKAQTDVVKITARKLVKIWRDYWYDMVDAHKALLELGIETDTKSSLQVLNNLLKPDLRAVVPIPEVGQLLVPEDPRIAALRAGLSISRSDWDLVYSFAADRAKIALTQLRKEGPK